MHSKRMVPAWLAGQCQGETFFCRPLDNEADVQILAGAQQIKTTHSNALNVARMHGAWSPTTSRHGLLKRWHDDLVSPEAQTGSAVVKVG